MANLSLVFITLVSIQFTFSLGLASSEKVRSATRINVPPTFVPSRAYIYAYLKQIGLEFRCEGTGSA